MATVKTQRDRIFLLLSANLNKWVSLSKILDLRIGQYNARIKELRDAGFKIDMRDEWHGRHERRSWYRLRGQHIQESLPLTGFEHEIGEEAS